MERSKLKSRGRKKDGKKRERERNPNQLLRAYLY